MNKKEKEAKAARSLFAKGINEAIAAIRRGEEYDSQLLFDLLDNASRKSGESWARIREDMNDAIDNALEGKSSKIRAGVYSAREKIYEDLFGGSSGKKEALSEEGEVSPIIAALADEMVNTFFVHGSDALKPKAFSDLIEPLWSQGHLLGHGRGRTKAEILAEVHRLVDAKPKGFDARKEIAKKEIGNLVEEILKEDIE